MSTPTIDRAKIDRPKIDVAKVPASVLRFAVGAKMQFADSDPETGIMPFRMMARSLEAIEHYYWGRIVHDFSGMILRKDSVTVDWAHGWDEVLGFANQFSVTDAGLEVSGSLVTTEPNDKADEVYRKGKAGVPYEASIDWNGPEVEIEYIPDLVSTEVNGRQFSGPGYVVRKWPLRAIAICRYGVDPDTRTQFSKTEAEDTVSVSITTAPTEESIVSTAPAPAANSAATVPADGEKQFGQQPAGSISIEMLKQFHGEFGDKGTEFLTAGLSLDAARYQFAIHERDQAKAEARQFSETLVTKDKEIDDLKSQLKQFGGSLGQEKPIETSGKPAGADDPQRKQFALSGGENRAAFAAAMKLKGA